MTGESRKGDRTFLAALAIIAAVAYGYAVVFETPGRVSGWGVVAPIAGTLYLALDLRQDA